MSDQDPKKPSLLKRIKPHIPALCIGVVAGSIIALKFLPNVTYNITMFEGKQLGDVWLSPSMIKQLIEKGGGMIQLESGELIDLINQSFET
jgi:hypothetical protein